MSERRGRIKRYGSPQMRLSTGEILPAHVGDAEVEPGIESPWVDGRGSLQRYNRVFDPVQRHVNHTKVVISLNIVRVDRNRALKLIDCLFGFALFRESRRVFVSLAGLLRNRRACLSGRDGSAVALPAANAAGVAIYVIDASGLSVGEAPHGIDPRGNIGLPSRKRPDIYGGEDPTDVRGGENGLERALKRSLASAQPDRIGALSRLSNQTGGMAITNNNDLAGAIEAIDADARSHYTVSYVPRNQDFDGRFREIAVRLENPDFNVRTRRGYHAVKSEAAITEEAPVRKLVSDVVGGIDPQFTLGMAASYFPRGQSAYLVPVTIKAPAGAISTQKKGDRYYADLDFVMTVKDPSGAVVSIFGRAYPLELNEDQNRQLGELGLPIRHNVRLAPGTYIITTALRDRASGRTALARRGIALPPVSDASRLSSIILAQRTESLPPDYPATQLVRDVLAFGRNRVVMPTESRFAVDQTLLLFFRVYPGTASFAHPSLLVGAAFFKDGKLALRTPAVRLTQSPASPDSGFPMATPLKLTDLAPGEYILRVELIDEGTGQHEIKEARLTVTN